MVLSSGAWPFSQGPPFALPLEVRVHVIQLKLQHCQCSTYLMAIVYMYMYVAVEYRISVPCRMLTAFSSTTIASEKLQLVPDLLHLTTQWKKTELALSVIKGLLHACGTCTSTSTFLYSEYVLLHLISYQTFPITIQRETFEGENFRKFCGFVAIRKSLLCEIWGCGILWHDKVSNP